MQLKMEFEMSEKLKLEIQGICFVHIVAIVLAIVFFMIFYMKAEKNRSLRSFLIMQISIIGWMVFKIFKTVSPTESWRWTFIVGYYFFVCIFEVTFLEFAYAYYKGTSIRKKIKWSLYALAMFQFSWILTNPFHHLFYATYNFWKDSFGILFYIHSAIVYTLITIGFGYGTLTFKKRFKNEKTWYKITIATTILLPMAINFLYITKVLHRIFRHIGIPFIFDMTPILFVISILVFVYATFNHKFIEVSPLMRHEIVHKLDTAIAVVDSDFDIVYLNEKLERVLGEKGNFFLEQSLKEIDGQNCLDQLVELKVSEYTFMILIKALDTPVSAGYLLIVNNITDYKEIENKIRLEQSKLTKVNRELEKTINHLKKESRIGARNYVARELHDIIGHSLVVTIKLLEVAKLYFQENKDLSYFAVQDSLKAIDMGMEDMEAIALKDDSQVGEELRKRIKEMLLSIEKSGVKSKLSFKGLACKIHSDVYNALKKASKELITNSLKHGKAKEMFLSIHITREKINLVFMDSGVGTDRLEEGNGLKGIRNRVKNVGGTVQFTTSKGEGFMARICIKEINKKCV